MKIDIVIFIVIGERIDIMHGIQIIYDLGVGMVIWWSECIFRGDNSPESIIPKLLTVFHLNWW